jgi:hypothetical protein
VQAFGADIAVANVRVAVRAKRVPHQRKQEEAATHHQAEPVEKGHGIIYALNDSGTEGKSVSTWI